MKKSVKALNTILDRAARLKLSDRLSLLLDISYSKVNIEALAKADDTTFAHDVCGIYANLNRKTKTLENCFVPRVGFQK